MAGAMGDDPTRIAYGGKALYGARVGILMLETRFPRIPGEMGNAPHDFGPPGRTATREGCAR
ncbi:MAG TPA: hypothetical protein VND95_13845 [Stellaceae bacterium]|nr:hypothetical protein [Stellaceae bacterium]